MIILDTIDDDAKRLNNDGHELIVDDFFQGAFLTLFPQNCALAPSMSVDSRGDIDIISPLMMKSHLNICISSGFSS